MERAPIKLETLPVEQLKWMAERVDHAEVEGGPSPGADWFRDVSERTFGRRVSFDEFRQALKAEMASRNGE